LLIELIGNRFEKRENEKLFSYFYIPDQLHLVAEVHMLQDPIRKRLISFSIIE